RISELARKSRYQLSVKPESGNVGTADLLNEKISRITIGAYRKTTTRAKNTRRSRAPFFESATSISRQPPVVAGENARRQSSGRRRHRAGRWQVQNRSPSRETPF